MESNDFLLNSIAKQNPHKIEVLEIKKGVFISQPLLAIFCINLYGYFELKDVHLIEIWDNESQKWKLFLIS